MVHTDDGDSDENDMPDLLGLYDTSNNPFIQAAAFQRKTAQEYSAALDELQCMILRSGVFQCPILGL